MMLTLWLLAQHPAQAESGPAPAPSCWEPTTIAARRSLRRGERAAAAGELARAEARLRAALEAEPDCGATAEALGGVLLAAGRPEEARAVLTPTMARFPEAVGVLVLLARVAAQQGEVSSARMLARQAIALDPASLDALVLLNDLLRDAGDWPAVDALLERHAAHHDPADIACLASLSALDRGQLEAGRVALSRCESGGQDLLVAAARAHMSDAVHGVMAEDTAALQAINRAMEAEDWQGALDRIDALPPPLELSVRIVRATCLYNLDRLDEALVDLQVALAGGERLLASDPERAEFYTIQLKSAARMQARALARLERTDEALDALRAARRRLGQDYDLHRTEILLLARAGRAAEAAAVWQDAAARWPGQPDLYGALSDIIAADREVVTDGMWTFLGTSRDPADQFAVATRRMEQGDAAGCLRHADQALRLGAAGSDVANLGYHCAIQTSDLAAAAVRREQLGVSVMPVLLFEHGLLAMQLGERALARELLESSCPRLSGVEQGECQAALESL